MTYRKKLIEVALPLDAINGASAKEKSLRQPHYSLLLMLSARQPLAFWADNGRRLPCFI